MNKIEFLTAENISMVLILISISILSIANIRLIMSNKKMKVVTETNKTTTTKILDNSNLNEIYNIQSSVINEYIKHWITFNIMIKLKSSKDNEYTVEELKGFKKLFLLDFNSTILNSKSTSIIIEHFYENKQAYMTMIGIKYDLLVTEMYFSRNS